MLLGGLRGYREPGGRHPDERHARRDAIGAPGNADPPASEDSRYLVKALQQFGVRIVDHTDRLEVHGSGGELQPPRNEIYLGNAGTALRYLTTFAGLVNGETVLTGDENMQRRPIQHL